MAQEFGDTGERHALVDKLGGQGVAQPMRGEMQLTSLTPGLNTIADVGNGQGLVILVDPKMVMSDNRPLRQIAGKCSGQDRREKDDPVVSRFATPYKKPARGEVEIT